MTGKAGAAFEPSATPRRGTAVQAASGRPIPIPVSTFVGRLADRERLISALQHDRLITLCGPPGVGKTRLAVETCSSIAADMPGGACWVDLTALTEGEMVVSALARALGAHEQPGQPLLEAVVGVAAGRVMLLVLDNCEHHAVEVAGVAQTMLERLSGLKIVATSRQSLGVVGEHRWAVPPLSLPVAPFSPESVAASEAGQLFCARALAVNAGFAVDRHTAPAIADICRRLDGIPLAIELAAARMGVLSAEEVAAALDDRFSLLGGGLRSMSGRHQSLSEALDWSYELLSNSEQMMFRRLSAFSGSPSLRAVVGVCAGGEVPEDGVLDLLAGLAAKSMVVVSTSPAPARFAMLETVRAYAAGHLEASDETVCVAERHACWYRQVAEESESHLTGSGQLASLDRMDRDYDDMHAALAWAVAEPNRGDEALRLAAPLTLYWRIRGMYSEGRRWLHAALEQCPSAPPALKAKGLWGAGFLALMLRDFPRAEDLLATSLALYRELDDLRGQGRALLLLGNARLTADDPISTVDLLGESATLARQSEDPWCLAHALSVAGQAYASLNDSHAARVTLEEGLSVARRAREPQGLRIALTALGQLEVAEGNHRKAERLLTEALEVSAQLGDVHGTFAALLSLGEVMMVRGERTRARELFEQGLVLANANGQPGASLTRVLLGRLAIREGDLLRARRLFEDARLEMDLHGGAASHMDLGNRILVGLGETAAAEGDVGSARALFEEVLANDAGRERRRSGADALYALGGLKQGEARLTDAEVCHCRALEIRHENGDDAGVNESLEAIAGLAVESGDFLRAARLLGLAESRRGAAGYTRLPVRALAFDAAVAAARAALGDAAFELASEEGSTMAPGDGVGYAVRGRDRRGKRPAHGWKSLTGAEREVARLVADNLTNAQIGERLFVSRETVKSRVASVFQKLGIKSRLELAKEVVRRDVADELDNS